MSVIDQKITSAQFLISELSKQGSKVGFMPDAAVVDALRYLEEHGIPTAKHEDYKYCNIDAFIKREFKTVSHDFQPLDKKAVARHTLLKSAIRLVILNGHFAPELSDLDSLAVGLTISNLQDADKALVGKHLARYARPDSDGLVALNTAFAGNGLFIHVAAKAAIAQALHIINLVHATDTVIVNPRQLVVVENNAQLTLVESFETMNGSVKAFNNHVSEIVLGENARVESYRLQLEESSAYQVNTTQVHTERYAHYNSHTYTFGGALVRNNLNAVIGNEQAEVHLFGLFVTKGQQLFDNHTLVDHQMPNCESNELYKGIAMDKSTGVFNGKIYVRKDAQKTNAYQSSKNILLSDDATINTKPQLEIYANDVKCSHGTSTGKIDEEAVFYLKSRGIGEESARRLLLQAFAHEVIDQIQIDELKEYVGEVFERTLA